MLAQGSDGLMYLCSERWSCWYDRLPSHLLPNLIMLLDALTNTYLGSRKSKNGDKAVPSIIYFLMGSGLPPSLLLREPK